MFFKIGFLRYLEIFTGKRLRWSFFLIKLQGLQPATLLKRDFNTGVFLWIFQNIQEQLDSFKYVCQSASYTYGINMFLSDMYFRLLEVVKCISRLLFVVFERMYLVIASWRRFCVQYRRNCLSDRRVTEALTRV